MGDLLLLLIGTVLVNNFVLTKFLGLCPFMGVSNKFGTAVGMSLIAAMGSFMPPVALTAVIAAQVVDETDYLKIVRPLILPSIVAIAIGVLMIKYATQIARLVL